MSSSEKQTRAPQARWPIPAIVFAAVAIAATTIVLLSARTPAPSNLSEHQRPLATAFVSRHPFLDTPAASPSIETLAAKDPETAIAFTRQRTRDDAPNARAHDYVLISALQRVGEFDRAADYAITDTSAFRRDLLIASYHEWGRRQPDLAVSSALRVIDAATRQVVLESALSGWAQTDPEALADFALNIPDGPEKSAGLTKAMRAWLNKDPWKAGDWIVAHENSQPIAEKMFRDDRR